MPLSFEDIRVGAIAYFDHEILLTEPEIDRDDDHLNRPGPFVCVQVVSARSVWCAISGEDRPERLFIQEGWRRDGNKAWRLSPQYLVDGLATYLGPNDAFVRAAAQERVFTPYRRPWVTALGVEAILEEINKQGGPLIGG